MAGNKYIKNNSGTLTEQAASQTSAGAGDAGKIIALDATGKIDTSMLPPGAGPETFTVQASENLAAGDFVNIHSAAGAFRVRKADASTTGKEAHGFVLAAVTSGNNATVYALSNENNQVSGATPGVVYLSTSTPGGFQASAPSAAGQTSQRVGVASSATTIETFWSEPIVLA